jgi:hypothetical protein
VKNSQKIFFLHFVAGFAFFLPVCSGGQAKKADHHF